MIDEDLIPIRFMCDKRGVITSGIKSGNWPKSVDYFVVEKFAEIKAFYGEQPKKLFIYFPSDERGDFFSHDFVLYRIDKQMVRRCNGRICFHKMDEEIEFKPKEGDDSGELRKRSFAKGSETECVCKYMPETIMKHKKEIKNPKLCSLAMYLKAYIANPVTGKQLTVQPILFRSGSKSTLSNLLSELKRYPFYRNVPFRLEVEFGKSGATRFPIWTLMPHIDYESLIEYQLKAAEVVETGFKMLPMAEEITPPVRDGQFNNAGDYNAGPAKAGPAKSAGTSDEKYDKQFDEQMKKEEEVKTVCSECGFAEGHAMWCSVGVKNPPSPPLVKGGVESIQDAEFTELPSAGSKSGVKNEKPANHAGVLIECIESFDTLQKLNQWWIKEDLKGKIAVMSSADRNRILDARDAKKKELSINN